MRRSASWRAALAVVAGAAAIAAGTSFASPSRADAAAKPTPTPTPTPSPPPHGPSCDDGTNGPGWIDGVFAIPDPNNANVSGNTALAIYPDSNNARMYFSQYITQLRKQQALAAAAAAARAASKNGVVASVPTPIAFPAPQAAVPAPVGFPVPQATPVALSVLLQSLQPTQRGTTVDTAGNWACHGLPAGTYRILATSTALQTIADPTVPSLPQSAANAIYDQRLVTQVQQRAGMRTTISTYYYTLTLNVQYNSSSRTWETQVPFSSWTLVATIVQG